MDDEVKSDEKDRSTEKEGDREGANLEADDKS